MDYRTEQNDICEKYHTHFVESELNFKVGISANIISGARPLNGLRHPIEAGTTGWYIWAGEDFSTDSDFFMPLHVQHLIDICPMVMKYLGLPPGWRFLITEDYEDVWQDEELLNI